MHAIKIIGWGENEMVNIGLLKILGEKIGEKMVVLKLLLDKIFFLKNMLML